MPDGRGFRGSLLRSLAVLRADVPWLYDAMARALGDGLVHLSVDGDDVWLGVDRARVTEMSGEQPTVSSSTTREAILRVIDHEVELEEAIVGGEIDLCGDVTDILRFHEALRLYVQGAVRSPRFPGLLRAYRRGGEGDQT